ncbi:ABC transporter permease [Clostridium niameyense]|uniref:ABC transporter permease n=1 Tax=Clostridium niameyense TaxID=1622073 RepID=A0A6M0R977_9CLOT|nr:ABC transporter permease [Clostridium niameyense]NEZ46200.1 ABC transporter permease [Clostridium niameyense]
MGTLLKYELKKIFKRKSTIIALIISIIFISILSILFVTENSYVNKEGNRIHGLKAIELKRKDVSLVSGSLSIDKLTSIFNEYEAIIKDKKNFNTGTNDLSNNVYNKYVQNKESVLELLRENYSPVGKGNYDYYILYSLSNKDVQKFYKQRNKNIKQLLSFQHYSENQKKYILSLNNKISTPLYFDYSDGWNDILARGFRSVLIIIAFVVSICIAPIFAFEYETGADAILLSTKYGKNKLIKAKIIAGILFATIVYIIEVFFFTVSMLCCYGISGWNISFQIVSLTSIYPLTVIQVYLLGTMIGYLVMLSITSVTMALSSKFKTPFSAIIISLLWIFAPLFIPKSKSSLLINNILNLFPANAFNVFSVFSVYDTYTFNNIVIMLPKVIIMISFIMILIFLPTAFYKFKKHQVV